MNEPGLMSSTSTHAPDFSELPAADPTAVDARSASSAQESTEQRARRALSSDIHLLGNVLGDSIRRLAGNEAYDLVEEIRAATKNLLRGSPVEWLDAGICATGCRGSICRDCER